MSTRKCPKVQMHRFAWTDLTGPEVTELLRPAANRLHAGYRTAAGQWQIDSIRFERS